MWNPRQRLGDEGEQVACRFLKRRRYAIVERNYRCRVGEIDVVALERDVVVFVEVKTRTDEGFGTPLHAVDDRYVLTTNGEFYDCKRHRSMLMAVTSTSGLPVSSQCARTRPMPPPVMMPTEFRPAATK